MRFKKIFMALALLGASDLSVAQIGGGGVGIGQGPTFTNITGSTQCLHANSVGTISGTGADCGSSSASGANPTGTVGLSTVNGSAGTFLRSDGAPALSQSITPTWTGLHKFTNSDLSLLGSSTGKTIFSSANSGASDFTITFPALTATLITSGDTGTVTNTMLSGSITLANLAAQATNTIDGNATSGSAAPTALAIGTCSTAGSALKWTTNTGFGCNTSIDAATLGSSTFAAPSPIGSGTPSTGAFTTLSSTSAATGPGGGVVPYTLGQSGIPFILQSSGTLTPGTSAQLSLTTALAVTYANAYMWFPLNALSGSSAAGWYYVTCTSTSSCTIYTTTYSSGTPTVPGSPTGFTVTTVSYTQTIGVETSISVTVPAGAIGVNGQMDFDAYFTNNNSAGAKTCNVKYATTVIGNYAPTTSTTNRVVGSMTNSGVATVQLGSYSNSATVAVAAVRGVINSASSQTASITLTNAAATDYVVLERYSLVIH